MKTKYECKQETYIELKHLRQLERANYNETMIAKYFGISRVHLWRIRRDMGWDRRNKCLKKVK